jgi:hypothetical protein
MNKLSAEIIRLIDCLNSLHDGDRAVDLLVTCGTEAIAPLRSYLMEGKPSHIYQPRQRAVKTLARLGAKEVLIEYLCTPKNITDPVTRFGEEAVENTAARLLALWQTDDVFEVLLRTAYKRTLPGVIEALGTFRRPEPVPLFIVALMDDFSRTAAENALKEMGALAKPALMEAAFKPASSENHESHSHLLRRRSVMRILVNLAASKEDWPTIKKLLHDDDHEISILAVRIALEIAGLEDRNTIARRLIRKIPYVNWGLHAEIENCLIKHYGIAKREIAYQIKQRMQQPEQERASDHVLQMLRNIRSQVAGEINGK